MEMALQRGSSRSSMAFCTGNGMQASTPAPCQEQQAASAEEEDDVRRGPWTVDEDLTLINYISDHGDGRWNALARAAGLKRTGKSCRLRWLNYLRPDVKRGNFTADEQLLILDLHSRWGNRWSKIAQHLPGRTDNEIKNYWRTRVQKHAKQLNCDVDSKRFKDAMKYMWMPRLVERIQAAATAVGGNGNNDTSTCVSSVTTVAAAGATGCFERSPSMVTSSSSDSFTSESTNYEMEKSLNVYGGAEKLSCDWMQDLDNEFWSTEIKVQPSDQFQDQDLNGWVQSFSEGASESLWSLEDIWKMQ